MSVIPRTIAGALAYNSSRVENSVLPPAPFEFTCDYLGLPSDCTARILPSQINAIVSELVNLGACFDPDGTWDCTSNRNLCALFTTYRTDTSTAEGVVSLLGDVQRLICGLPEAELDAQGRILFCDGNGNIRKLIAGTDDTECTLVVLAICASTACRNTLAACLISDAEPDQGIEISEQTGLLYFRSHEITARDAFTTNDRCLRDQDPNPIFGRSTFFIPNTSTETIIVEVEVGLRVDMLEDINNGSGSLSFSVFAGPNSGQVLQDVTLGFGSAQGLGGNFDGQINVPSPRYYAIPPGGRTLDVGFQGGSKPDRSWCIRNTAGNISANGTWSRVNDVNGLIL